MKPFNETIQRSIPYSCDFSAICMIELLSVISASAAVGIRLALPLLIVALLYGQRLLRVLPGLSWIPGTVLLGGLIAWALLEMLGSKRLLSQRLLIILQLALSPFCGAIMGLTVVHINGFEPKLAWLMAGLGGLIAVVLQLVQVGWFYRLRGLPFGVVLAEDALSVLLVLAAFRSPKEGGLIALLLIWFAIRSAKEWRDRYLKHQKRSSLEHHRQPD